MEVIFEPGWFFKLSSKDQGSRKMEALLSGELVPGATPKLELLATTKLFPAPKYVSDQVAAPVQLILENTGVLGPARFAHSALKISFQNSTSFARGKNSFCKPNSRSACRDSNPKIGCQTESHGRQRQYTSPRLFKRYDSSHMLRDS